MRGEAVGEGCAPSARARQVGRTRRSDRAVDGRRRAGVRLSCGHASPARREPPRIPEETVPQTGKQRNGADAPQRRRQQHRPDDPEGYS